MTRQRITELGVLVVCVVVFVGLAWRQRFITDDAYISFRYARSIAHGQGPVFNVGERVEGYTNPLWVYLLAAGIVAGLDPEDSSQGLGLLCGVGAIAAAFGLSKRARGAWWSALVPISLAGSRDLAAWSVSGLEMGLFVLLVAAATWRAAVEAEGHHRPVAVWLASLAALTRPEGLLWVVLACLWGGSRRSKVMRAGIALALLIPLQAFRVGYYAEWVPNTFRAKGALQLDRGLFYVGDFLRSHPGIPLWAPVAALASRRVRMPAVTVIAFMAYLTLVGGDFMEFRMMVPAVVLSAPLAAACLPRLRSPLAAAVAVAGIAGTWGTTVAGYRQRASPFMIENVEDLAASASSWAKIGIFLGEVAGPRDIIAVGPAGAIPYYSGLPTVDMLGLCDAWVARHGAPSSRAAGHERVAPPEYLARRRVTWVIGQPEVRDTPEPAPERISLRMKTGRYLVVGTTLDADSLRAHLAHRGVAVAPADPEATAQLGRRAAGWVVQGWRLAAGEDLTAAHALGMHALESARDLGGQWRWLVREAGMLCEATTRGRVEKRRDEKQWRSIDDPVPDEWRGLLDEARGTLEPRLDTSAGNP